MFPMHRVCCYMIQRMRCVVCLRHSTSRDLYPSIAQEIAHKRFKVNLSRLQASTCQFLGFDSIVYCAIHTRALTLEH